MITLTIMMMKKKTKKKNIELDIDLFTAIIDKIFEKYYKDEKLYNKIMWDFLYWLNGVRGLPYTKELREIIKVKKNEN